MKVWMTQELTSHLTEKFFELSTSAVKRTPKDYEWYRFFGARPVLIDDGHRSYDITIESHDLFGVRSGREKIYIVHADDPTIEFTVSKVRLTNLLKKCKGYDGKVGRYKVSAGEYGALNKPKNTLITKPSVEQPKPATTIPVNIPTMSKFEDKALTRKLKSLSIDNINTLKFIMPYSVMSGEDYHIYDVGQMLATFAAKAGVKNANSIPREIIMEFEADVEARLHKFMPELEFDVTTVRISDKVRRILVVLK
jgi:hypothetical protein